MRRRGVVFVCIALFGCSPSRPAPAQTGAVREGLALMPVADAHEHVRFVARALWEPQQTEGVRVEYAKSGRGRTISWLGPDRARLEDAYANVLERQGATAFPEGLRPVFEAAGDDGTRMVLVFEEQGFELSLQTKVERYPAKGVMAPYLWLRLSPSQQDALTRMTAPPQTMRIAIVDEDTALAVVSVSEPMRGGTVALAGPDTTDLYPRLVGPP